MSSLAWTRAHFATLNCVCEHDLDEPDCSTGFCELDRRCTYEPLHTFGGGDAA